MDLSQAGQPVIFSLITKYFDSYIPLCEQGVLPKPLTDLFQKEYMSLPYHILLEKCDDVFKTYKLTSELALSIEKETRKEVKCVNARGRSLGTCLPVIARTAQWNA